MISSGNALAYQQQNEYIPKNTARKSKKQGVTQVISSSEKRKKMIKRRLRIAGGKKKKNKKQSYLSLSPDALWLWPWYTKAFKELL